MSWILLGLLIFCAISVLGVSAVIMAGFGLAAAWGLVCYAITGGDRDLNGRKD